MSEEPQSRAPLPASEGLFTGTNPWTIVLVACGCLGLFALLTPLCGSGAEGVTPRDLTAYRPADFPAVFADDPLEGLDPDNPDGHYAVPRLPVRNPDNFPCSNCHDADYWDPTRRELVDDHTEIVLNHDEEHQWCLDCHDAANRDQLHLADGTPVAFEESYRLCGQCHGTELRDWRAGAHGRRTGYWDGPKRYLLCVHCHWPHDPAFSPLEPLPPPVAPRYTRRARLSAPAGGEPQ